MMQTPPFQNLLLFEQTKKLPLPDQTRIEQTFVVLLLFTCYLFEKPLWHFETLTLRMFEDAENSFLSCFSA